MTLTPLEVLKKGLEKLKKSVKEQPKAKFEGRLVEQKSSSSSEERWLGGDANSVDEHQIVLRLERAEDYEKELENFGEREREIVEKLREYAGVTKEPSRKRKRPEKRQKPVSEKDTSSSEPSAAFTKKENATLEQRIEILDWHTQNGRNQTVTARYFNKKYPSLQLKQPIISAWVKDEAKWRKRWAESQGERDQTAKRVRQSEHPEVTEMMELWVSNATSEKLLFTGDVLRQTWTTFADLLDMPQDERLSLSNGWLGKLKARHGLKEFKRPGEPSLSLIYFEPAEKERKRIRELIKESGYERRDIFNMYKTCLYYGMLPDKDLSDKLQSGVKGTQVRHTYALTFNADGTEKFQPFIIGKSFKPRAFQMHTGAELGFYYKNNAKAWMTTDIYQEWIKQWDQDLEKKGRKILLLQDNFPSHIPGGLKNIHVEYLPPNLAPHVQPMTQLHGIIRCFKAHYRAKFVHHAINRFDEGITPSRIYDIDQLQGMRLAQQAWQEVDTITIRNCWKETGILPETSLELLPPSLVPMPACLNNSSPTADALLQTALDSLVSRGALRARNRINLEALVNPAVELYTTRASTDEDICESVLAAKSARDHMEENGGDDIDIDNVSEPRPTPQEFFQAASIINRYVSVSNTAEARQLETTLALFSHEPRINRLKALKSETALALYPPEAPTDQPKAPKDITILAYFPRVKP